MNCIKCNQELDENSKFCIFCGASQDIEIKETGIVAKAEKGKLTYSQNPNIKTTYNKDVDSNTFVPYNDKPASKKDPNNTKDGKTTASLVLGIISIGSMCFSPILATIGLILGIISTEKSTKRTIAIVINAISLITGLMIVIIALTYN